MQDFLFAEGEVTFIEWEDWRRKPRHGAGGQNIDVDIQENIEAETCTKSRWLKVRLTYTKACIYLSTTPQILDDEIAMVWLVGVMVTGCSATSSEGMTGYFS